MAKEQEGGAAAAGAAGGGGAGSGCPGRPRPRLCPMRKGEQGYGFHLHGEKGKSGQFIRKVEPDSPAEAAGLRAGDRVVEVNGVNVEKETHHQVGLYPTGGGRAAPSPDEPPAAGAGYRAVGAAGREAAGLRGGAWLAQRQGWKEKGGVSSVELPG